MSIFPPTRAALLPGAEAPAEPVSQSLRGSAGDSPFPCTPGLDNLGAGDKRPGDFNASSDAPSPGRGFYVLFDPPSAPAVPSPEPPPVAEVGPILVAMIAVGLVGTIGVGLYWIAVLAGWL
jgi:hypothetical protein